MSINQDILDKAAAQKSWADQRDGMMIEWNVPIAMDDGVVLRADIFRPVKAGKYPVILSMGPYGKGLHFEDGYSSVWQLLTSQHPEVLRDTTGKYLNWEVVDPEKWVCDDYVVVRTDSRGAGCSPGFLDHFSPREINDYAACVKWAAEQPWSTGKVGLNGISYYAITQWLVAAMQPPHLAAMCVWEGGADHYRDSSRQGGILSSFPGNWYEMQVAKIQYGYGTRGPRSRNTGELVCGPQSLTDEQLAANRIDFAGTLRQQRFDTDYYKARTARWDKIKTPFLSAGNWGGQGLHLRGNVEGFVHAASEQKWLEMHGLEHWTHFMTDYGVDLQKRFFGYFLKGEKNGWEEQPKVQLQIRRPGEKFDIRHENEWPIARTQWIKYQLDPTTKQLQTTNGSVGQVTYDPTGEGITFSTPALEHEVEITGPLAAKLFISSETQDADIFAVLRVFDPDGKEVAFHGTIDPHTPIAQGWLRASHRKIDPIKSRPYRPWHAHDELQPLRRGEIVALDVELQPTCIVVPVGYRIALTIRGRDYEREGPGVRLSNFKTELKGCGPFIHEDLTDRPPEIFHGKITLHFSAEQPSYVLLPIIPKR